MELLDGVDLFSQLSSRGPVSAARALEILEQVCAATSAAHDLGIVHRDIKASNVMLTEDLSRSVLIDFGLAKLLEGQGPELTASRATIGTPACISPEQIRSEPVDRRTDVYALGALAYHLVTGEAPFSEGTALTIHYMHLHSRRPRPSSRVEVPPGIDEVIVKAMARDPEERFQSATALVQAFADAVRGSAPASTREREGLIGLYVDVSSARDLQSVDDSFFDDLESIVGRARDFLAPTRFLIGAGRNNSALFITSTDGDELGGANRLELVELARRLSEHIEQRPGRDRKISVRIVLDATTDLEIGSCESELLEASTRVCEVRSGAVFVTERFAYGLSLDAEVSEAPSLLRVL
jgi:serine/threonine-protein kinase